MSVEFSRQPHWDWGSCAGCLLWIERKECRIELRGKSSCKAAHADLCRPHGVSWNWHALSALCGTGLEWPGPRGCVNVDLPGKGVTLGKAALCSWDQPWRSWQLKTVCRHHIQQWGSKLTLERDSWGSHTVHCVRQCQRLRYLVLVYETGCLENVSFVLEPQEAHPES